MIGITRGPQAHLRAYRNEGSPNLSVVRYLKSGAGVRWNVTSQASFARDAADLRQRYMAHPMSDVMREGQCDGIAQARRMAQP
jgi:hypothetical protein